LRQFLFTAALPVWALALTILLSGPSHAWKNGPPGNKVTNSQADCANPPYSTHDWIADHGQALLTEAERAWLGPHRRVYLIGTEAPDHAEIQEGCGTPHRGYDDTGGGRHDLRFDAEGNVTYTMPALRAQQEYEKAAAAFRSGRPDHAAFYLGAAVHYIGDLAQYGHTMKGERHHADFEEAVGALTPSFDGGGVFEKYIVDERLAGAGAYDAVIRTGRYTRAGPAPLLPPPDMDERFHRQGLADAAVIASVGAALNRAVNETAAMLRGFYETVVRP